MPISATIIADSATPTDIRVTTLKLRYPRLIHSEFMTHRVLSRNASSSRAIPVERLIKDVIDDPAMPIYWGSNKKGMQAGAEVENTFLAGRRWLAARDSAVEQARLLNNLGLHKQIVNRVLEPFAHINVLVTATDWNNFFSLRRHPDAQPEIRALADAIADAVSNSRPKFINYNDWHLPYVNDDDIASAVKEEGGQALARLLKVSTARSARVSYETFETGKISTFEEDDRLHTQLVVSQPVHASPAEHQVTPDMKDESGNWKNRHLHGNLRGVIQYRKLIAGEAVYG